MHRHAFLVALLVAPTALGLASVRASAEPVTPVPLFERSPDVGSMIGNYLAGGADVSGDGIPDILLGTVNQTSGRIWIFSGGDAGVIATIDGRSQATFLGSA